MDFDLQNMQQRLIALFGEGHRLVFWEDPENDYADAIAQLQLPGASLVDATSRELATKRLVLREQPEERFVIYRSGPTPPREDDLLYDIKCMAAGFSCKVESIWAEGCGIDRRFQDVLAEHAPFFDSEERRSKLASLQMPKDSEHGIRIAMIAACADLNASTNNERDAVRDTTAKLLVEYAEQKDAKRGRKHMTIGEMLGKFGLEDTYWDAAERIFGYRPPRDENASIADLALRMLITDCAQVMPESEKLLSSDAVRVLRDLQSGSGRDGKRKREAFEALAEANGRDIADLVPNEFRNPETLEGVATLPEFDEWTLAELAERADAGTLTTAQMRKVIEARREGFWFERYRQYYETLAAAADFLEQEQRFKSDLPDALGPEALFEAYCSQWYAIDRDYRRFCRAWHELPSGGRFRKSLEETRARLEGAYDQFLSDLAERWQRSIDKGGAYPPSGLYGQQDFYSREVLLRSPSPQRGRRVAVVISDALRYEVGRELAARLSSSGTSGLKGRVKVECEGMLSMLPSYTQLGMAALLPSGPMEIDPSSLNVRKDGQPTQGRENRQKALERARDGSLALQASDLLQNGLPDISGASIVYVYHDAIDARGDDAGTQSQVFDACEDALDQIEELAAMLVSAGCGTVLVTADHGFIYQDGEIPEHEFVDVEDLNDLSAQDGIGFSHKDRFIVGDALPSHDSLIECTAGQLSLEGRYRVAFPRGITRLRKSGSGKQYVHGGASLQECAIPIVRVDVVNRSEAARPVGVQGFVSGRRVITGGTFSVDVYQEQPCDDLATPLSVKVGIYAPDDADKNPGKLLCESEQRLELDSEEQDVEERKTRVRLHLTDDVDDYPSVQLRILARKGSTNSYACAWECELTVRRAFGSDF